MVNWIKHFITEYAAILVAVFIVSAVGSFIFFSVIIDSIVTGINSHKQAYVCYDTYVAYHIEKVKGVDNFEDYWYWCGRK